MGRQEANLYLLVTEAGGGVIHPLPAVGKLTVGRSPDADVPIADDSVSREHAVLHIEHARVLIEDLDARNGTWINGQRLAPGARTEIGPRDTLRVGRVNLQLHGLSAPASGMRIDTTADLGWILGALDPVVASPKMAKLHELVEKVAPSTLSVLVLGETGVGKEVVVQQVHARSPRRDRPLVALNCASLPEALLENELFGHEKGAFTGADEARPGLLESASGGTVFLDEVGEMPLATQSKLLRVIEEREVRRLGSTKPIPLDVRFIAATNQDLEALTREEKFRRDLYFRLNGITLRVPPLRERATEIAPLARRHLTRFCAEMARTHVPEFTAETLSFLERYSWPGNIRELLNVVERAVLVCGEGPIRVQHVMISGGMSAEASAERDQIAKALDACAWNQTRAAKLLGISRRWLVTKIDQYGLPRPRR
jgi:DNA-binding NtrC family response regulator